MFTTTNIPSPLSRLLHLLPCLLLTATAFAQPPAAEAVIKDIRSQYTEAMEKAQRQLTDDNQTEPSYTTSTLHYMRPGCGTTTETLYFFYELEEGKEPGEYRNSLYLCTRRFNVAPRQFYEEYLFDPQTQEPLFVYLRYETYEGENAVAEERYYFHDGQIVWKIINQYGDSANEGLIQGTCSALLSAFTYLVNHNY